MREFADTSDIPVHKRLIEQVLGQEEACTIIRQAARQRRHVLLVGDHGIGKSMLGQAMAELIEITNPDPVPCDFVLVLAGNIADLEKIHPALRSRIRGYGYEVSTHSKMDDTPENRWLLTRLVAQEVRRDGKIPHFSAPGVQAVLAAAGQRAGQTGQLSCHFRELGGLIRIAGDIAVREGATLVEACDVHMARKWSRPIAEQMALSLPGCLDSAAPR